MNCKYHILFVMAIPLISTNSHAQYSPTNKQIISKRVNVTNTQMDLGYIYRKDIHHDLNKFEGTWVFVDQATNLVFTLEIEKKVEISLNDATTTQYFTWSDDLHGYFKLEINNNTIVDHTN